MRGLVARRLADERAGCSEGWLMRVPIASRVGWCEGSLLCSVPTTIVLHTGYGCRRFYPGIESLI